MKYLLKDKEVWGVPEALYVDNTTWGWTEFQKKLLQNYTSGWGNLKHQVKENYALFPKFIEPWHDDFFGQEEKNVHFYHFPEPIDGHVGFLFILTDTKNLKEF